MKPLLNAQFFIGSFAALGGPPWKVPGDWNTGVAAFRFLSYYPTNRERTTAQGGKSQNKHQEKEKKRENSRLLLHPGQQLQECLFCCFKIITQNKFRIQHKPNSSIRECPDVSINIITSISFELNSRGEGILWFTVSITLNKIKLINEGSSFCLSDSLWLPTFYVIAFYMNICQYFYHITKEGAQNVRHTITKLVYTTAPWVLGTWLKSFWVLRNILFYKAAAENQLVTCFW